MVHRDYTGDRDMECLKSSDRPDGTEFVGRLKIVLVETPPSEYMRREWVAALVMAAYYLMGAINISMMYYTLMWWKSVWNHLHIWLCTSSMTFFTPTAILFYNRLSGTGGILEPDDRMLSHGILHATSFAFMLGGLIVIFAVSKVNLADTHTFVSLTAVVGVSVNIILGVIMARDTRPRLDVTTYKIPPLYLKLSHRLFGVLCLVCCSASYITGLFKIGPIFTYTTDLPNFLPVLFAPLPALRHYLSFLCVVVTMIASGHALFRSYF